MNWVDKIKKLLALAESDNENEAKAALLKARELMAEHKVAESDIAPETSVRHVETGYKCSKRKDPWMQSLATLIGENYCCQAYTVRGYGKQTHTVCFVGLDEDVELCVTVFSYAVDFIHKKTKKIRKENSVFGPETATVMADSYGIGFFAGVQEAFQKQTEQQQEWGLVLVTPEEVTQETSDMKRESPLFDKKLDRISGGDFADRLRDGRNFKPERRITNTETEVSYD